MNIDDLGEWRHRRTILSADLGKLQDYTALSIINQYRRYAVPHNPQDMVVNLKLQSTDQVRYELPYLHRLPLDTSYTDQVRFIRGLFDELRRRCKPSPILVIDATGVGTPVADMFREIEGLYPIEVWFTGGNKPTRRTHGWNVPKADIIGALQRVIGRGELMIAKGIPEAPTLIEEATRMEAIKQPSGYVRFSHREGEHDDLVLSVGIGLWCAFWFEKNKMRTMPGERLGV